MVQNAVRNLLRTRRRQPASRVVSIGHAGDAIPDRHEEDNKVLTAFREFLSGDIGADAVRLLDRRLAGVSLRQLAGDQGIGPSGWALRQLMRSVRQAALEFARPLGDNEFLAAIERLTGD